ncbi:MAG: NAD(P)/FAD-dependent oxidoreductase [Candidatus Limivicinus sp.]
MKHYDAVVIGAGVLGCFAARSLCRWKLSTLLLEGAGDVCTGITRANTAIIYPGYDNRPGSLKARMTVRANAAFPRLCEELEVPFKRCGSLMLSYGPAGDRVLLQKLAQGQKSGVPGLALLSGAQAEQLEPGVKPGVSAALYAPGTGTVNPWQLGIAACESAVKNGCELRLNSPVAAIRRQGRKYIVETAEACFSCAVVINCAGLAAGKVQELLFPPRIRIFPDGADYLVLDKKAHGPRHILFHETEERGKGLTAVPTAEGGLLLGPNRRPLTQPYAVERQGMEELKAQAAKLLPGLDLNLMIRSFGAVRPNPQRVELRGGEYVPTGQDLGDFPIDRPEPGFFSLLGIKTPGLTCADELGQYLAAQAAEYLNAEPNRDFAPRRAAIPRPAALPFEQRKALVEAAPDYGDVLCLCEDVSRGEVMEAIRRGAVDVEGVKRRTGTGLGRCQGGRCRLLIEELLE